MKDGVSRMVCALEPRRTAPCIHGVVLSWIALAAIIVFPSSSQGQAHYEGRVVVEWIVDPTGPDRDMKLVEPFTFYDPQGIEWAVPAGAIVNGASIPRVLWSTVGPPFVGDYRSASVVHDYFCITKERPWEHVHRMFYDGLIASGVGKLRAKVMYGAVFGGGPRWSRLYGVAPGGPEFMTTYQDFSEEKLRELEAWIEINDPDLGELESKVQSMIME